MQIQALYVEGTVCVPRSVLVLGGSSRSSVVLRVSGRFFAVLWICRFGQPLFSKVLAEGNQLEKWDASAT